MAKEKRDHPLGFGFLRDSSTDVLKTMLPAQEESPATPAP